MFTLSAASEEASHFFTPELLDDVRHSPRSGESRQIDCEAIGGSDG